METHDVHFSWSVEAPPIVSCLEEPSVNVLVIVAKRAART